MVNLNEKAWELFKTLAKSKGVLELTEEAEYLLAMELSDAGYAKVISTPTGSEEVKHSGQISTYSRRDEFRVELTPQGYSYLKGYVAGRMAGIDKVLEMITTELTSKEIEL